MGGKAPRDRICRHANTSCRSLPRRHICLRFTRAWPRSGARGHHSRRRPRYLALATDPCRGHPLQRHSLASFRLGGRGNGPRASRSYSRNLPKPVRAPPDLGCKSSHHHSARDMGQCRPAFYNTTVLAAACTRQRCGVVPCLIIRTFQSQNWSIKKIRTAHYSRYLF